MTKPFLKIIETESCRRVALGFYVIPEMITPSLVFRLGFVFLAASTIPSNGQGFMQWRYPICYQASNQN